MNAPKELEDKINQIISNKNHNLFENILLFYFMIFYENFYFYKIVEKENIKRVRYEKILKDRTLEILLEYLNYSDKNENKNFQLLFRISFIKLYFRYRKTHCRSSPMRECSEIF